MKTILTDIHNLKLRNHISLVITAFKSIIQKNMNIDNIKLTQQETQSFNVILNAFDNLNASITTSTDVTFNSMKHSVPQIMQDILIKANVSDANFNFILDGISKNMNNFINLLDENYAKQSGYLNDVIYQVNAYLDTKRDAALFSIKGAHSHNISIS
jgi:hypothetical protein